VSDSLSYSRIDTYKKCPFKYKLLYVDNHQVYVDSVSTEFGTLVHYIEESMGKEMMEGKEVNIDFYRNLFLTVNEEKVKGVNFLKEKYIKEWYEVDKHGFSHEDKAKSYYEYGITNLKRYMNYNINIFIHGLEIPFEINLHGKDFRGFIDRVYYDKTTDTYIIEDIKTYTHLMKTKDLKQSLQMYVYTEALKTMLGKDIKIRCYYNLPIINTIQESNINKNYIINNLDKLLNDIDNKQFYPKPTPLCHWCVFSKTYPNQPDEAKNLCPYFSKWTKENKTDEVENEWQGDSMHQTILENFVKKEVGNKND
jgi:putative RecB family exonuclease